MISKEQIGRFLASIGIPYENVNIKTLLGHERSSFGVTAFRMLHSSFVAAVCEINLFYISVLFYIISSPCLTITVAVTVAQATNRISSNQTMDFTTIPPTPRRRPNTNTSFATTGTAQSWAAPSQPQQQETPAFWNPAAAASVIAAATTGGGNSNAMLDLASSAGKSFFQSSSARMIPGLELAHANVANLFCRRQCLRENENVEDSRSLSFQTMETTSMYRIYENVLCVY